MHPRSRNASTAERLCPRFPDKVTPKTLPRSQGLHQQTEDFLQPMPWVVHPASHSGSLPKVLGAAAIFFTCQMTLGNCPPLGVIRSECSASSASSWVSKFSTTSKVLPKDACGRAAAWHRLHPDQWHAWPTMMKDDEGCKVEYLTILCLHPLKAWGTNTGNVKSSVSNYCIPSIFPGLAWPPVVFALDQSWPARSSPCEAARVGKPTAGKHWGTVQWRLAQGVDAILLSELNSKGVNLSRESHSIEKGIYIYICVYTYIYIYIHTYIYIYMYTCVCVWMLIKGQKVDVWGCLSPHSMP